MFDGFSFDAPSSRPFVSAPHDPSSIHLNSDYYCNTYTDISPTCSPAPNAPYHQTSRPPAPLQPMSISDLAQRFRAHNIDEDDLYHAASAYFDLDLSQTSTADSPTLPSLSSPTSSDFSVSSIASGSSSRRSSPTPSVRERRQAHTTMQCGSDARQLSRDIETLVERMINEGEQCVICDAAAATRRDGSGSGSGSVSSISSAAAASLPEDEGVELGDGDEGGLVVKAMGLGSGLRTISAHHTLRYRRSGELSGRAASVSKNIRVRKRPRKSVGGAR